VYWAHLFKIGKYSIMLKFQVYKRLDIRTKGIESRIPKTSLHVVLLDYDNIIAGNYACENKDDAEKRLVEELQFLQEEFEIGNFYVFETRGEGRHAVCLDALRFRDVKDIVDFSSCDLKFKSAPRINEYRCWVLRFANKGKRGAPKYLYTVESPFEGKNLQSLGHAKYLLNFGLKVELKNPYGPEEINTQGYSTTDKHVEEPVEE
jgi:hypothetical protein